MEAKKHFKKICCCMSNPHSPHWWVDGGKIHLLPVLAEPVSLSPESVSLPGDCAETVWDEDQKKKNKINMLSRKRNKSCFSSQFKLRDCRIEEVRLTCFSVSWVCKPRLLSVTSTINKIGQTFVCICILYFNERIAMLLLIGDVVDVFNN